uniref:Uncharacterized protein n=1 Tax=Romanomermis culicivorax TaxID=13658 RepID=A0A915IVY2_ROMCU
MASIKRHLTTPATASVDRSSTANNHSKLSFNEQRAVSHSPSVATALYCLRFLLSKPVNEHSENENNGNSIDERWTIIAQSALWSILALKREMGNSDSFVDETTLILALAIFLIAAPPSVVSAPNLLTSCVKIFQEALSGNGPTNQYAITVLQSAQSIFRSKNKFVANTFIRALTPTILQKIRRFLDKVTIKENEEATNCDKSDAELIKNDLAVFIEAEKALKIPAFELLSGFDRFPLVSLNVQILATFLPFESANPNQICISKSSGKTQQQRKLSEKLDSTLKIQLQELALEKLNKLGPEYPSEFKLILQRSPDIKSRLENALKKKEAAKMMNNNNNLTSRKNSVAMQQQPAITLSMNFSNFTAAS